MINDYKASSDFIAMLPYWKSKINWSSANLIENFNDKVDVLTFRFTDDINTRITRLSAIKDKSTGKWASIINRVITTNGATIDENITSFTGGVFTFSPIRERFEGYRLYVDNQLTRSYNNPSSNYDPLGCSGSYYYYCYLGKIQAMNIVEVVACIFGYEVCYAALTFGCICECLGWWGC